jgi:outer membrane protein
MNRSIILALILAASQVSAQTTPQKIGHADWEYIFGKMPEYGMIEKELQTFQAVLQKQMEQKRAELDAKYKTYQDLPESTPDPIKKDKEAELNYLQENLRKFQQDASESIQKKQNDLVTPVFTKVGKAIEDVAKENGYSYIVNPQMIGGGDVLLYTDEKYDISNLVLKKLGIKQ